MRDFARVAVRNGDAKWSKFGLDTESAHLLVLDPDGNKLKEIDWKLREDGPGLVTALANVAEPWLAPFRLRDLMAAPADFAKWVDGEIAKLASPEIEVRSAAADQLKSLSRTLDAALEVASRSDDAEVRAQVAAIRRKP